MSLGAVLPASASICALVAEPSGIQVSVAAGPAGLTEKPAPTLAT